MGNSIRWEFIYQIPVTIGSEAEEKKGDNPRCQEKNNKQNMNK